MRNTTQTSLSKTMALMEQRRWPFLGLILLTSLTVAGMAVPIGVMTKRVITAVTDGSIRSMQQTLLMMLGAELIICLVTPITTYLSTRLAKETMAKVRNGLFTHIMRLPKAYFDHHHSGELLSSLTNDMSKVDAIYAGQLYTPIEALLIGSLSLIMAMGLDWRLALIALASGAVTARANLAFGAPSKRIGMGLQSYLSDSSQRFLDLISGNREIKLFGINQQMIGRLTAANQHVEHERRKLAILSASQEAMNYLLSDLTFFGLLGAGGWMVVRGATDWGTVVAMLMIKLGTDDLFLKLGSTYTTLQASLAGADRFFELMEAPEERATAKSKASAQSISQNECMEGTAVCLSNLSFSYDGMSKVLDRVNLSIKQGETIAIVGTSGSGKSTLIKLLTGLYSPQDGQVWLNGVFAYVPQDGALFQGSIAENIRYGRYEASDEELLRAAKVAHVHDFVTDLPDGYETKVGENGSRLSGGQKQRVAIARALLRDAPILILDEGMSALDAASAAAVQDALDHLMRGRTTIIITHQPEQLPRVDRILRLEKGRLLPLERLSPKV